LSGNCRCGPMKWKWQSQAPGGSVSLGLG
jgi:hypothetical protein